MMQVSSELSAFAKEARHLGLVLSAKALERAADLAAVSERERPRPDEITKERDIPNG